MPYSLSDIERALQLPDFDSLAAHQKMTPAPRPLRRPPNQSGQARVGAVLLMLYPRDGLPHLILTRRPDTLRSHAGQISLPGGRREPGETLPMTALRETQEEIGIEPQALRILGALGTLYIPPSDFEVHPFVAWHGQIPTYRISPLEVAELIEVPLSLLIDETNRAEEQWEIRGAPMQIPFFHLRGHKVWGATAMILSEFVDRLQALSIPSENIGG